MKFPFFRLAKPEPAHVAPTIHRLRQSGDTQRLQLDREPVPDRAPLTATRRPTVPVALRALLPQLPATLFVQEAQPLL